MTRRLFMLASTLFLGAATGQLPLIELSPADAQRIQHVNMLLRELTPQNNEEYTKITPVFKKSHLDEVRQVVQAGVLGALSKGDDPEAVGQVLRSYVDSDRLGSGEFVYRNEVAGVKTVVVGYAVYFGSVAISSVRVAIDGYRNAGSVYELAAETGQALENCALQMAQLQSPRPGETWFLAHGQVQYGGATYKEMIRIYSFDGYQFKEIWAPEAAREHPRLEISKDSVQVTYDGPNLARVGFRMLRLEDTVHLTESGPVVTTRTLTP
jgi:hypothetical protein